MTASHLFPLAPQGPSLSRVAAGLWRLHEWRLHDAALQAWVEHALSVGITTFDHADLYGEFGNEALFGRWLKANPSQRDAIQLVSKCGIKPPDETRGWRVKHYDSSADHIEASVHRSLQQLGTDRLDLLLLHRPDPLLDAAEVAACFERLRTAGKVLHFGVSNYSPSQFALLASYTTLATNQVEASLRHLAPLFDGTFDQCQQLSMRPMIWSPLAGGQLLSGEAPLQRRLSALAAELGVTPSTLALAWLLRLPCRPVPIIGSGRAQSLDEAAQACNLQLDRQYWFSLLEAAQGHCVP